MQILDSLKEGKISLKNRGHIKTGVELWLAIWGFLLLLNKSSEVKSPPSAQEIIQQKLLKFWWLKFSCGNRLPSILFPLFIFNSGFTV